MSAPLDEARFRVLHALRVKGAATAADTRTTSGVDDAPALLAGLVDDGLVVRREAGETAYFALAPAGAERHAEAVRARLRERERAVLADAYDARFLPLNVEFKRLCATWQEEGERFELVEQTLDVHERIDALLGEAARADERFAVYAARLAAAIDAFQGGDAAALVAPVGESFHNVWFELHEDLLVTLGRSRADEAA